MAHGRNAAPLLALLHAGLLLLAESHDLLLEGLVLLLEGLVLVGGFFHFLGLGVGFLLLGGHGLGLLGLLLLLLFAAAGCLGGVVLLGFVVGGGGVVGVGGSDGAGEGVSTAMVRGHEGAGWGCAHCFVGAGGFLGPSLGGDFCAICAYWLVKLG